MNRPRFYLALLIAACGVTLARAERIITTVAGGGPDQVQALDASIHPEAFTLDSSGRVVVLTSPGVIRIDQTGRVSVIAGGGLENHSGDGGPALLAQFDNPDTLAVDRLGRIVIADSRAARIRRIELDGTISTIAGTGYMTGQLDGRGGRPEDDLGDGGPATRASFGSALWGLAFEPDGDLLVSDVGNRRIRVIDAETGIITTRVGGGSNEYLGGDNGDALLASLFSPGSLAFDAAGNLFFVDGQRVRRVDAATNIVITVAGRAGPFDADYVGDGGPAYLATLLQPQGIAVRGDKLVIVDRNHCRVREVDLSTGIIRTVAGTGRRQVQGNIPVIYDENAPATSVSLTEQLGAVAFLPSGDLLFGHENRILRLDADTQTLSVFAGVPSFVSGDGGPARHADLGWMRGIAADASDQVHVASASRFTLGTVRRVDSGSGTISTVAGCVDPADCVFENNVKATRRSIHDQARITFDPQGRLIILDRDRLNRDRGAILRVDPETGIAVQIASVPSPVSAAYDAKGNLFVLERQEDSDTCLRRVDGETGDITIIAGTECPDDQAYLDDMFDVDRIAFDPMGRLHLLDSQRIRILDLQTLELIAVAGASTEEAFSGDGGPALDARFSFATDFGFDAAGNLLVVDQGAARVRRIDTDGIIDTIAGNGERAFAGDGGPALEASLIPTHVAVLPNGDFYVSDLVSARVRLVSGQALSAPRADAGPDRRVQCASELGAAVLLDGSGPSGLGDLSYLWSGPFGEATGATPTVTMPIGLNTVSLVVQQGTIVSDSDTADVHVTVEPRAASRALMGLVPESDPEPPLSASFRMGTSIPLAVGLLCEGGALRASDVDPPSLVEIRLNGLPTGIVDSDGIDFRPGRKGGPWSLSLNTRRWLPGAYEVVLLLPDGRRFKAAFALQGRGGLPPELLELLSRRGLKP